ncbi:MAG TPA: type II secretion system protein [Planctomycetota bacterium]|nr:type II secretion system protein [Planctomycetota bacterium]
MRKSHQSRGFTLLEMLVVIAIVATLAAILLPLYGRSRAEARRLFCSNNLMQLQRAMMMYSDNNFSSFPKLASRPTINKDQGTLRDTLYPLLHDERVFKCPDDNQGYFENEGSSYEWNALLNNKNKDLPADGLMSNTRVPMIYDYENFHPKGGSFGGKNVVFVDGHVEH